jgi:dihydrodipicolinate synthase/N-acetylneuraminate lyase
MKKKDYYDLGAVKEALAGPVPSVVTPFNKDGSVSFEGLRGVVAFLIEKARAKTLLLTHGDSLFSIIDDDEVEEITSCVVKEAAGRAMVIACGKLWGTGKMLRFAEFCAGTGADLFIPFPPDWAHSLDTGLLYEYYAQAAKIMPVMILSNLGTGRGVPLEVYEKLIKNGDSFVAVKDDMPPPYGRRLAALLDRRFGFLSGGRMENHLDVAPYGADGYLPAFNRFDPRPDDAYWDAYTSGDPARCARIINRLEVPFFDLCTEIPVHFSALISACMELYGICPRWRRPPYSSASDKDMERIADFKMKVIDNEDNYR